MNTIIKKWLKVFSCLALTLSIILGVQASSSEAFLRANQLYSLCSSEVKLDNAVCEGYIIGVNDEITINNQHIAIKIENQFIIGTDNGMFSLIFDEINSEGFTYYLLMI